MFATLPWRYSALSAVGHKECCPKSSFFCGENGRITVVYHKIAVVCSNSATGVEIVKKERFRRGFYCCTIFQIKSTKNLIIRIKIRAKNEPKKAIEIARIFCPEMQNRRCIM